MKAVAVFPGTREVRLVDHPEPRIEGAGQVKVRMLEVGVCGTDKEICEFEYGTAPPGSDYFVLGHESLGEVVETAPDVTGLRAGDLVVGAVRLPCPHASCAPCRGARQDFCETGDYAEHGIKDLHGFMTEFVVERRENVYRLPPQLRDAGVLVEPLTIAEKALIEARAMQERLPFERGRRTAVVAGAGPVGLLGAMALVEAGYRTLVYSRSQPPNVKTGIVEAIGAEYVSCAAMPVEEFAAHAGPIDLIYEAAGAPQTVFDLLLHLGPNGLFVFTGVPGRGARVSLDARRLVYQLVMNNQAVMGTVNAGPDAFAAAIRDLGTFMRRWPLAVRSLITARWTIEEFRLAVEGEAGGIKNVIEISSSGKTVAASQPAAT